MLSTTAAKSIIMIGCINDSSENEIILLNRLFALDRTTAPGCNAPHCVQILLYSPGTKTLFIEMCFLH